MRSRRWSSLLVAVALLVAGCSSDRGDERIDLGADGSSAEDADGEVDGSSAEDAGGEVDGSSAEEPPLYPPLPPLDPDPTSDVSLEDQRFFLDLHAGGYEASQHAFATGQADQAVLGDYFGGDALDEILSTVERWASEGTVSRSPDGEVTWLEVVDVGDGQFRVLECSIAGTQTGLYDIETGEPVDLLEAPSAVVIVTTYSLIAADRGSAAYRATSVSSHSDPEICDV